MCIIVHPETDRAWIGPNTPKRGAIELFAGNLPGVVDNIRRTPRGTFWVGLSQARHHDLPSVLDRYGDKPKTRAALINVSFTVSLSVSLSISPSVYPSVRQSIHLSVR